MNNKSTENLIHSDGSIEELIMPPSKPNKIEILSVANNVLNAKESPSVTELTKKLPIPATRKSLLPAINSDDSKDTKTDRNNKTTPHGSSLNESVPEVKNDPPTVFALVNERKKCFADEAASNSGMESAFQRSNSRRSSALELPTIPQQTKSTKQRRLTRTKSIEESSIVSYEEKHEHEDNSENLSVANIDQHNKNNNDNNDRNEADELAEQPKPAPKKRVHKNRSKKSIKSSKSRDLAKNSKHMDDPPLIEAENIEKKYDFKKIIGIRLHETSALRFDPLIRHPRVRVSIYNRNTGKLLDKSNPARNAVLNYEPTNVTFIQPILSNRCIFKESSHIECYWSDELLIINDDIRHIQTSNILIFFEIIDFLIDPDSIEQYAKNGWYKICWAFFKPGDGKNISYIDQKCKLQLHEYQRNRNKFNIWDEWRAQKRIKYPAYLSVTVESYETEHTQSITISRPMSVMEEEKTGDIYAYASSDDCVDSNQHQLNKENRLTEQQQRQHINAGKEIEKSALNLIARLPGEECKCPNRVAYKHDISVHHLNGACNTQYGSMTSSFSPNGELIAFHCTSYMRSNHEIIVMRVKNMQIIHTLIGHLSIIYGIDWLDEQTLVSVSSDRTAIIWKLADNNSFALKIMPHPSFVYTVKWLNRSSKYAYLVTGGRDCVLRIWKQYFDRENDIELCDEIIQHENYITSMVASRKGTTFYTADWSGVLLEWIRNKSNKEQNMSLYRMQRKIKIFPTGVLVIELHPKLNRLYVQCVNDPILYVIETTSAVVIQTMQLSDDIQSFPNASERKLFTISPCGSLIFTNLSHHEKIDCFQLSHAEKIGQFLVPLSIAARSFKVTSIAFHPTMNLMACTVFGDLIDSSIFLAYHDDGKTNMPAKYDKNEFSLASELYGPRSNVPIISSSNTIASILEQIDHLFFMAVHSPKSINDLERLKKMQTTLQNLQNSTTDRLNKTETLIMKKNHSQANNSDLSSGSNITQLYGRDENESMDQARKAPIHDTLQDCRITVENDAENSTNSSKHTFVLETAPLQKQQMSGDGNNTYSIASSASEQSDLVSEINNLQ